MIEGLVESLGSVVLDTLKRLRGFSCACLCTIEVDPTIFQTLGDNIQRFRGLDRKQILEKIKQARCMIGILYLHIGCHSLNIPGNLGNLVFEVFPHLPFLSITHTLLQMSFHI